MQATNNNYDTIIIASVLIMWIAVFFFLGFLVYRAIERSTKAGRKWILDEENEAYQGLLTEIDEYNQSIN